MRLGSRFNILLVGRLRFGVGSINLSLSQISRIDRLIIIMIWLVILKMVRSRLLISLLILKNLQSLHEDWLRYLLSGLSLDIWRLDLSWFVWFIRSFSPNMRILIRPLYLNLISLHFELWIPVLHMTAKILHRIRFGLIDYGVCIGCWVLWEIYSLRLSIRYIAFPPIIIFSISIIILRVPLIMMADLCLGIVVLTIRLDSILNMTRLHHSLLSSKVLVDSLICNLMLLALIQGIEVSALCPFHSLPSILFLMVRIEDAFP